MRGDVLTAAEIAMALERPKRSVLESLKHASPSGRKVVFGNEARVWSKDSLPKNILVALDDVVARRKTSVDALLASQQHFWRPRYSLGQLCEETTERASLLQRCLAPTLARMNDVDLTTAEFEQLGVEDYRITFGHSISTRHWRRLLKRTVDRDGGAENWGRLEIYLEESPARKPELRKRGVYTPTALRPLQELISSFANPADPTEVEKDCLWIYAFEHYERETERTGKPRTGKPRTGKPRTGKPRTGKPRAVKRATLNFLFENASFLGKSEKGIKLQFDRKLKRWIAGGRVPAAIADARRKNPGRPTPKFSEQEEHALIAKSLRSGGGLAQAWRESREKGLLGTRVSQHYTSTPARKSYVPDRIRKLIANKVKILRDHHHGPRRAKLNGAYINRDPSTFHAGDWFQADDCTLPNYYYTESDEGFQLVRGQFLAMCDVRTTFILGYVLIPQRNYTAHHIRNLTTTVADTYGLPRRGFYYENGMWRTARLLHGRRDEINWFQTEMGLRGLGLQFCHAKLPRGKVIERVFGLLQSHLESVPGYAGRDERHDKFERVQEQLSLVRRGKAQPEDFFLSEPEYLKRLEAIVRIYNEERQEGKYCPGLSPREAFEEFHGEEPRIRLGASCRHLLATHKMRVRSGRNGISFRFGKEQFTYKSFETGRLIGQELIAWFNVENPSAISVTNLKEDPQSLFTVEREIKVPGMDAPPEVLEAAIAQNEAHEAYRKGLYRAVSQNFSSGFAGRMFRQNLIDHKTAETAAAMEEHQATIKRKRAQEKKRRKSIEKTAARLGIASGVMSNRPQAEEGLKEMTGAMRRLGLLRKDREAKGE
jgi:hypothetical protein